MDIVEFKNKVNLIYLFVARLNEENFPNDIKKVMVKVYANTLRINLSDNMADNITKSVYNNNETIGQEISS